MKVKRVKKPVVAFSTTLLLLLAASFAYGLYFFGHNNPIFTTVLSGFHSSTPRPQKTTYQNQRYGYAITYPTQWYLSSHNDDALIQVDYVHSSGVPNPSAFEIKSSPNPDHLDAQTWWKQNQPPYGLETGLGGVSLESGLYAYKARGVGGQSPYIVYTITTNQIAVQIFLYSTNQSEKTLNAVVNSFIWK